MSPKGIYEHHSRGKNITRYMYSGRRAKLPVICFSEKEWGNINRNLAVLESRARARVKISKLEEWEERMGE